MNRAFRQFLLAAVTTVALYLSGPTSLAGPPLADPNRLLPWWQHAGPGAATYAAARTVLLAASAYWLIVVGCGLASAVVHDVRLAIADTRIRVPTGTGPRTTPDPAQTRSLLRIACGAAASAVLIAGCRQGDGPASEPITPPALVNLGPIEARVSPPSPPKTLSPARPDATPHPPPRKRIIGRLRAPAAPLSSRQVGAAPASIWVVEPGDDLWSIAAATVARAAGTVPNQSAIASYWVRLIEANTARLPNPADPSLLFPGDTIALPSVTISP